MATELFQPVGSRLVDGFTHHVIQGTLATTVKNPFRAGHISQFSCVGLEPNGNKSTSESTLRQISSHHGRSYEFVLGEEAVVIWEDEHGNIYTKLNTKGNNCTAPNVYLYSLSPSGFLFFGLQDSDSLVRVLRASDFLRSHHIDTEAIVKVIEPAELPYNGENVPLPEFKRRLVHQIWERDARDGERYKETDFKLVPRKQIPELSLTLDKMTFFFTVRGVQVTERLADLAEVSNEEEFLRIITNAFRFVNIDEAVKARENKDYRPETFSPQSQEDIERYFSEYLPRRTAHNFAKMLEHRVVLVYSHAGNISTVGSLFDLDSVRGEPLGLGDQPVTYQDWFQDVKTFLDSLQFLKPKEIGGCTSAFSPKEFGFNFLRYLSQEMGFGGREKAVDFKMRILGHHHPDLELLRQYIDQSWDPSLPPLPDPEEVVKFLEEELPSLDSDEGEADEEQGRTFFVATMEDIMEKILVQMCHEAEPDMDQDREDWVEIRCKLLSNALTQFQIEAGQQNMGMAILKLARYKSLDDFRYPLYQKLTKQWGWEEDIAHHAWGIDALFAGFGSLPTLGLREYYLTRLSEQLGWDFSLSESPEEMIAIFHEEDQKSAKARLEKAFAESSNGDETEKIIENALKGDAFDNFTWDHSGRYFGFVIEYVRAKFEEQRAEEMVRLREKYGEKRAEIVAGWFQQRYDSMLIDGLADEVTEEIERVSEKRIEVLKAEYSARREAEKTAISI